MSKSSSPPIPLQRLVRTTWLVARIGKYIVGIWVFGIIWFAGPFADGSALNSATAIAWIISLYAISSRFRTLRTKRILHLTLFLIPILAHFTVRPSHDRDWKTPYSKIASATIDGETLTIHNFRSFDYDKDGNPIESWSDQSFDMTKLQGMDFFMSYWGSEYMGHPIFSFDFGDQGRLAFTIEAKTEDSEEYSLLAGLYKRYELAYIPCEEADAVRVRTNFRKNEQVHLYRTIATPEQARARLLEFLKSMNSIKNHPRFYNIISSNCTTAVRSQMNGKFPWDWRVIVNGKLDKLLFDREMLITQNLPFPELKRRAFINPKVREHPQKEDFSNRIRENVPGFSSQ